MRVFRKAKFHAKAYIRCPTGGRGCGCIGWVVELHLPGLHENIELNVQITGRPVAVLQECSRNTGRRRARLSGNPPRHRTHIRDFSPFEVYVRALQELFRKHELTSANGASVLHDLPDSRSIPKGGLLQPHRRRRPSRGAFLCDGVGLGKTYVGLMLIERLVVKEKSASSSWCPSPVGGRVGAKDPTPSACTAERFPPLPDLQSHGSHALRPDRWP